MGASPDGILIFPLFSDGSDEYAGEEGGEANGSGGSSGTFSTRLFSSGSFLKRTSGDEGKQISSLSAVERDIARAVLEAVAAAKRGGSGDADEGTGGSGNKHNNNNNNKRSSANNAKKKKKKKKKKKMTMMKKIASSTSTAGGGGRAASSELFDDNEDQKQPDAAPPWGAAIPPGYAAVAVEVKVSSPFRWSTSGLTSYNNMASYKVDWSADLPRDHVQALHAPQLQLEALAARVPGTLLVSYTPAGSKGSDAGDKIGPPRGGKKGGGGGSGGGGGGARIFYVPVDGTYQRSTLSLLREYMVEGLLPGCFSSGGGGYSGCGSAERREAYGAFIRRTRRVAAGAVAIADLAPVSPAPGTEDTEPFLRVCGG